jgi:DNA-binding MarR family transcriptional regulator
MTHHDLAKIKHFIRVSFEIEESLDVSSLQKKILLKTFELWGRQSQPAHMSQLAVSIKGVSERSVYRHLKILIKKGWLQIGIDQKDRRIKIITPSNKLIHMLSTKLSIF